jgi:hypothetical protein
VQNFAPLSDVAIGWAKYHAFKKRYTDYVALVAKMQYDKNRLQIPNFLFSAKKSP